MGQQGASFAFHDLRPDAGSFVDDVLTGLSRPRKAIAPKYFYDERGSALFEAICALPEYYPTRTEMAIMEAHGPQMAALLGRGCVLIEFGSGSGRKTLRLIEWLEPARYVPIDIAAEQLEAFAVRLAGIFPALPVSAVCADYSAALELPDEVGKEGARRVAYFPGSTIGNFTTEEARAFLRRACALVGAGGAMLVGVDLKKAEAVLHAAYNDVQGVTAAFNLNLLARINRELGADFDLSAFRHRAFYNAGAGRIEMHLESMKEQEVKVHGRTFRFQAGETIHTENSYKYSADEFRAIAREAGFEPARVWTDEAQLFAVHHLVARG